VVMIAGMDSTRRTEMFVDSEADRRADTATWGEERTMLVDSLRAPVGHVGAQVRKPRGRRLVPSRMELLRDVDRGTAANRR
jgi:hypothetical protein